MDKGIRPAAIAKFLELAPQRVAGTLTNTQFRKNVMASIMEDFGITLASAATHYNHAFIGAKTTNPELVVGLGRPEDKKGGRKKKEAAPAATATVSDVLMSNVLQAREGNEGEVEAPAAVITDAAAAVGLEGLVQVETAVIEEPAAPIVKYSVKKVADGTVVCSDLTLEEANALIAKAAAAKKSKLELVQPAEVAVETQTA